MGDVANDMVNGACCEVCQQYFVRDHGYPVLCARCFNDPEKNPHTPKATEQEWDSK